ncbi:MFS transporter [Nocardioides cavernaquae]|uniref:MFS transporter n=1 Tax=Nocardioides cavernaquae TaxID=2321396 RepID=A0A3A5HC65_9ACTN|nr:MFS transporter [Nocardioides cavernaquae]RJS47045.1 MFS transporter [Nocardioides cavernaquae]
MTLSRRPGALLALASIAVAFAAADTYVVVLALPDMMATAGVPISDLQRAAPIISGFLLGYIAMLPLIGRIADLRGRVPVLVMSLVVFAIGSFVTAFSWDLGSMVTGRFLQGVGGGGLVPATLALVADLYPAPRRAVPLGVVSAVQEIGSVLGPLFGALVLALTVWQAIFMVNLVVAVLLALTLLLVTRTAPAERPELARREVRSGAPRGRLWPDPLALLALGVAVAAYVVLALRPARIQQDLTWGQLFIPYAGDGRWLTPLGVTVIGAVAVLVARCFLARRPLVDLRSWLGALRQADLPGATLLAIALGGIVLAFATADPEVQVFAPQGRWYLLGSLAASIALVLHLRSASAPLIPRAALRERPAWGALLVSLLTGAALIAALVDIPIYARTTLYPDSQLMAALVLVRFLVALPVGAVVGGQLTRRYSPGPVAALGMACAALGFLAMSRWDEGSLTHPSSTLVLLLCGFGFGLALAPVNAALLAHTDAAVHGVATALVVVARMIGMLVGISALTTIGLRRFHAALATGRTPEDAALIQEHVVFLGAAGCAAIAGVLALVLLGGRQSIREPSQAS